MVDLVCFVLGVGQQFFKLSDVLPGFSEVERSKVLVEAVISEVLGEGMGTLSILK